MMNAKYCNKYKELAIFKPTPLALALVFLYSPVSYSDNYFNPAFFSDDPTAVSDLSHFASNSQLPGEYQVDVVLNNTLVESRNVVFVAEKKTANASSNSSGLTPCFDLNYLRNIGVKVDAFPQFRTQQKEKCVDFLSVIPDSGANLDFDKLRLDLSIPQAALNRNARDYISPEEWDEGITALLLNYNFTGSNSKTDSSDNGSEDSYFLSLNSGLNLGPWRLRDNSSWNYSSQGEKEWQHISTYVQRAIIPLRSELTMGDDYTSGELFESFSIRGATLETDDTMLPDSLRGFAPTIRGIAKGNAQVTVKQNNMVLYQTYVPAGAFEIDDLYPTSSSGDLVVEVKEADGSIQSYSVPYSTVPLLQREGYAKYSLTAGKYRSSNDSHDEPEFLQWSLFWGLPYGWTLYGGTQYSDNYASFASGAGVNLGVYGAVSADIIYAKSRLADDSEHTGQSIRFLYAKSLNTTGTNFQLLGYRYSTSGFYSFEDTTYKRMSGTVNSANDEDDETPIWESYYNLYYTKRGKIQANISQQLGEYGSLFISGSQQSYWHTDSKDSLLQAGYNTSWGDVTWGLSYNYNKSAGQPDSDQVLAFNISLPLGKWLSPGRDALQHSRNIYANYNVSTDDKGNAVHNVGLNGTALEGNNLSYSLQESYDANEQQSGGGVNLNYQGSYGNSNLGYNYSSNGSYRQINYGLSGGVIAHKNGITLSQPLGESNVLVAAPGASDVAVDNNVGIRTDWRGYAVVPYASNYRQNRIALNTNTLANSVDVTDAVTNVVPTRGAVVRASFDTQSGSRVLMRVLHNQRAIPFGSVVTQQSTGKTSIADDDGIVYLAGMQPQGVLTVQWGAGDNEKCQVKYVIPEPELQKKIIHITGNCN